MPQGSSWDPSGRWSEALPLGELEADSSSLQPLAERALPEGHNPPGLFLGIILRWVPALALSFHIPKVFVFSFELEVKISLLLYCGFFHSFTLFKNDYFFQFRELFYH